MTGTRFRRERFLFEESTHAKHAPLERVRSLRAPVTIKLDETRPTVTTRSTIGNNLFVFLCSQTDGTAMCSAVMIALRERSST